MIVAFFLSFCYKFFRFLLEILLFCFIFAKKSNQRLTPTASETFIKKSKDIKYYPWKKSITWTKRSSTLS